MTYTQLTCEQRQALDLTALEEGYVVEQINDCVDTEGNITEPHGYYQVITIDNTKQWEYVGTRPPHR